MSQTPTKILLDGYVACLNCGNTIKKSGCHSCRAKIRMYKCDQCGARVPNPEYIPRFRCQKPGCRQRIKLSRCGDCRFSEKTIVCPRCLHVNENPYYDPAYRTKGICLKCGKTVCIDHLAVIDCNRMGVCTTCYAEEVILPTE